MSVKPSIILLSTLTLSLPALAQPLPTSEQLLGKMGIEPTQVAALERGEIVSYDVRETSQKELAVGAAMLVPASLPTLVDAIKQGQFVALASDIKTYGTIDGEPSLASFKKFGFTAKDEDEAQSFIDAEAGDTFNLSDSELASLTTLKASLGDADSKTLIQSANQKYREFLLQRLKAYRTSGLAGIAPYARSSGKADPAAELRKDTEDSQAWAPYVPELQRAWLNYPAALPAGSFERWIWYNQRVEDRPTAILNHRVFYASGNAGIMLSRQFYVGHSYNSSQTVAGALPYGDKTLVFYSTRSSTDQVAGMGSSVKHAIGREQLRKEVIRFLQRVNQKLHREPAVVVPDNQGRM